MGPEVIHTIESSIRECDSHILRLRRAYNLLREFFPLSEEAMAVLAEERIEHIDQFIYRFIKLQDSMGVRLLPSLHSWLQGEVKPMPFLDILSDLEKFGVMPSERDWQFFRNLRNNLDHDYPENIDQTVITLNTLFEYWHSMENIYLDVRSYCIDRIEEIDSKLNNIS